MQPLTWSEARKIAASSAYRQHKPYSSLQASLCGLWRAVEAQKSTARIWCILHTLSYIAWSNVYHLIWITSLAITLSWPISADHGAHYDDTSQPIRALQSGQPQCWSLRSRILQMQKAFKIAHNSYLGSRVRSRRACLAAVVLRDLYAHMGRRGRTLALPKGRGSTVIHVWQCAIGP